MTKELDRRFFLRTGLKTLGGLLIGGPFFLQGCVSRSLPVPKAYQPKYRTIAHKILDIEVEHNIGIDDYLILDTILDSATNESLLSTMEDPQSKDEALIALRSISDLLDRFGFVYEKVSLLCFGLSQRRVNCDGYSALYLAIGELLGLPIKMVRAPQHTFVRWHLSKQKYINWETTISKEKEDAYYISQHNIAKRSKGRSSLRSLDVVDNRNEILANAYVNSGVEWLRKCRLRIAIDRFQKAIQNDPDFETPYYNTGLIYYHMGKMPKAINWCKQAVHINPNHLKSHAVLQSAYSSVGARRKSRKHLRKVIRLDSTYYDNHGIEARRKRRSFCRRSTTFT